MNNSSYLFLALLILVFGCNQKESLKSEITVSGQLANSEEKIIEVFINDDISSYPLDENGGFSIQFNSEDPETYFFRSGRQSFSLFLIPGDSVYVSGNADDFNNSFKLEGNHVVENTYLFDKSNFYYESNMMDLMSLGKEAYFEKKDAFFVEQKNRFEKLTSDNDLNPEFLKVEIAYFEYEPLLLDLYYPNYYAYTNNIQSEDVDFPAEASNNKLSKVDLGRSDYLKSRSYTGILEVIIDKKKKEILNADPTLKSDPDSSEKATYLAMEDLLKNQSVKDHFHFKHVKSSLGYRGPVHVKPSIDKFMAENQSPKLEAEMKKAMDKWAPVMPGKEVPDFSFLDVSGKHINISDLRGTLVYIDIWATWCKPCIAEHPHWDRLKEEYKDKPVSFLTISIDEDKEAWEKMVDLKKMGGLQWLAENGWNSAITQHFFVSSIPRFIILDKEGKIIDPSAERPSGNIRATLDQFL